MKIDKVKIDNPDEEFIFVDATAGDGFNKVQGKVEDGSALIVHKLLYEAFGIDGKWRLIANDSKKSFYNSLHGNLDHLAVRLANGGSVLNGFKSNWYAVYQAIRERIDIRNEKYQDLFNDTEGEISSEGIIYIDPPGMVDFDCMPNIITQIPNADIYCHIGCAGIKRQKNRWKTGDKRTFEERFEQVRWYKNHWLISDVYPKHHWIFLYGVDDHKLAESIEQNNDMNFTSIESTLGIQRLEICNYTKEELVYNYGN